MKIRNLEMAPKGKKGKRKSKSKKSSVTEAPEGTAPTAEATPEGCFPLFLSVKSMEKYGLKTGPLVKDTIEFKAFNKEEIIGKG